MKEEARKLQAPVAGEAEEPMRRYRRTGSESDQDLDFRWLLWLVHGTVHKTADGFFGKIVVQLRNVGVIDVLIPDGGQTSHLRGCHRLGILGFEENLR